MTNCGPHPNLVSAGLFTGLAGIGLPARSRLGVSIVALQAGRTALEAFRMARTLWIVP
ncbi:hypothetical protein [Allokutzneria sp. A3M-2-11 16]|uniref:hypothetical protein n=1 Tax=Allokutzneria sp. A3M-2-11 16 TaxID=2962043 RepID=UPI0020B7326A|nr:hypothetical protein [Allokutzneria sp. A3M-2-11 16]